MSAVAYSFCSIRLSASLGEVTQSALKPSALRARRMACRTSLLSSATRIRMAEEKGEGIVFVSSHGFYDIWRGDY